MLKYAAAIGIAASLSVGCSGDDSDTQTWDEPPGPGFVATAGTSGAAVEPTWEAGPAPTDEPGAIGIDGSAPVTGGEGDSVEDGDGDVDAAPQPFQTPQPSGCIDDVSPGEHVYRCDGSISYTTTVPAACVEQSCGLIFDVHGATMNAGSENRGTNMREIGLRENYIIVQPSRSGGFWDFGDPDDANVFEMMQLVASVFQVDSRRVHMMGFSQGGHMTYRFACRYSDTVASFAPIAGGERWRSAPGCYGAGEKNPKTSILHTHGTGDGTISFRTAGAGSRDRIAGVTGAQAETVSEGRSFNWERWRGNGIHFEFVQHSGGHCIPATSGSGLYCRVSGPDGSHLAGEIAMDFFKAHPLGESLE